MINVLVTLSVDAAHLEEFLVATLEMAHAALEEDGCRRFEVLRQEDLPTQVVLYQVFNSRADGQRHLETEHFKLWRSQVAPMLAEPMQAVTYTQLF